MTGTESKFALIGAGPMGLATARNLQRFEIPFDGFESHHDVGGLWDIANPHSTVYDSAHLISSKRMTELREFPMRDSDPDYPDHRTVCRYFRDFADHFGLRDCYHFNTRVQEVRRDGKGWQVTTERSSESSGGDGTTSTHRYRGVLIANGTLSEPNLPRFDGEFDGELLHACRYKSPEIFEGKRVLVVGAGNSGCDIAVDAVHRAREVAISVRRGYHFVPKYVFGKPADAVGGGLRLPRFLKQRIDKFLLSWFTGDPVALGFPPPDHRLYESHPIVNSLILYHLGHGDLEVKADIARFDGKTVHFKDGSHGAYDLILLATGYQLHYPFIDRAELNWRGSAPHLYLNCFHPESDNLFVMGMVEAAGLGWEGRSEQAELVARFLRECDRDSAAARRFRRLKQEPFPDMRGGFEYLQLDRMAYYVHKDTYRNTVRRHLRELGAR
jgi:hypothetical protein